MSFSKNKRKRKNYEGQTEPWKIKEDCLNLILECSKSSYPKEFAWLLRAYEKQIIEELIVLPGTLSGDSHAIFQFHMLPIDFSIVGTIHSHPSISSFASQADLQLFNKYGKIHIIAARPFNTTSWRAYAHNGKEIDVEII